MAKQSVEKDMVNDLPSNFPDCPQREMALTLLRRGLTDQAQAWIDALNELQDRVQSEFFSETKKTGSRRA